MNRLPQLFILLLLVACLNLSSKTRAADWNQFRGPLGNGHASGTNLPKNWGEQKNVTWKTEILGKGWSSPVASGDTIWMTTAVEVAATEEEKEKLLEGQDEQSRRQKQVVARVELKLISVDAHSGRVLSVTELQTVEAPAPIHNTNSYASPTPVVDDGQIYCDFGTYGTFCVDNETKKTLWASQQKVSHSVGPGSSPFVYKNLLILVRDGLEEQYVTALNKLTGNVVWRKSRPPIRAESGEQKKSYCTPILVEAAGKTQLIIPGSQWLISYEPETGDEIWRLDHGKGFSVVPRPVFGHGMVFFSTGFGKASLLAVRTDGEGDVTDTHLVWTSKKQIPTKPSPLLVGDELYVISDKGIATCFDAKTGKSNWVERISGNYAASPLYVDGNIHFSSVEGKTTVVQPGVDYVEVTQNSLDGGFHASPVVFDNAFFLRTETHLYRIEEN